MASLEGLDDARRHPQWVTIQNVARMMHDKYGYEGHDDPVHGVFVLTHAERRSLVIPTQLDALTVDLLRLGLKRIGFASEEVDESIDLALKL